MFSNPMNAFAQGAIAGLQGNGRAKASQSAVDPRLAIKDMAERAEALREAEYGMNPDTFGNLASAVVQYNRDAKTLGYTVPGDLTVESFKGRYGRWMSDGAQQDGPPQVGGGGADAAASADGAPVPTTPPVSGGESGDPGSEPSLPFGSQEAMLNWQQNREAMLKAAISIDSMAAEVKVGDSLGETFNGMMAEAAKAMSNDIRTYSHLDAMADTETFVGALQNLTAYARKAGVSDETIDAFRVEQESLHKALREGRDKDEARQIAAEAKRATVTRSVEKSIASALGGGSIEDGVFSFDFDGDSLKSFNAMNHYAAELIAQNLEHHEVMYMVRDRFGGVEFTSSSGAKKVMFPVHKVPDLSRVAGSPLWSGLQRKAYEYLDPDGQYHTDIHTGKLVGVFVDRLNEDGLPTVIDYTDEQLRGIIAEREKVKREVERMRTNPRPRGGTPNPANPAPPMPTPTGDRESSGPPLSWRSGQRPPEQKGTEDISAPSMGLPDNFLGTLWREGFVEPWGAAIRDPKGLAESIFNKDRR